MTDSQPGDFHPVKEAVSCFLSTITSDPANFKFASTEKTLRLLVTSNPSSLPAKNCFEFAAKAYELSDKRSITAALAALVATVFAVEGEMGIETIEKWLGKANSHSHNLSKGEGIILDSANSALLLRSYAPDIHKAGALCAADRLNAFLSQQVKADACRAEGRKRLVMDFMDFMD